MDIPKGEGKTRALGIPTVKDRIVQTALKFVLEPIFEAQFREGSYGFRPGRGCKDALREVDTLIKEGYTFVVDADLQSYFDSIPHERLMQRVGERISDGVVLELIERFLKQDIMQEGRSWTPVGGTPQGAVISPLLANLYLHRYRFEAGRRHVRKKSLQRLKERIVAKTPRTRGQILAGVIDDLNPMLKGWFAYFKHAHEWTFGTLDGQIRRRLRAMLRKQEKRPGFGRCHNDHRRWPNAFFAEAGLFVMHTAWLAARQSR